MFTMDIMPSSLIAIDLDTFQREVEHGLTKMHRKVRAHVELQACDFGYVASSDSQDYLVILRNVLSVYSGVLVSSSIPAS